MNFASSWSNYHLGYWSTLILLLSSPWFESVAASCLPDQRSALLHLKQDFSVSDLPSWLPDTDCCHGWEGVFCDVSNGHVITLDLSNRNIQGNLSGAIFNLTSLQYLDLAHNDFSQNLIPDPGFEKLTMLTHLDLSYSNFVGQIPIGIANLTNLIYLDLSCDPPFLTLHKPNLRTLLSNLRNLRELRLNYVDVSENATEWCEALSESVPLLQVLSMVQCNLSGPIHPLLSRLNSLSVIELSSNSFNSPIPDYFSDFPLKNLGLSNCNITGFFPRNIFQIPTLTVLDLSNNKNLLVTIPDFSLESSLERLNLDSTTISNQIPDSIGNLRNLSLLSLSLCNLTGQIPAQIAKLAKLEYLYLSYNSLSGSIPQTLFDLQNLKTVSLNNNKFSGEFNIEEPSSNWSSSITYLDLSVNQLNGSIPQTIYKFSKLETLDLSSNQFSGPIPNSIFGLSSIQELNLETNKFSGMVDLSLLQYLSNLTFLYLSNNQLSLQDISREQLQLPFPKITAIGLASCNLSQIPRLLRYHGDLSYLDLSNNQLQGVIPSWLWEKFTPTSISLNLSRNMITSVENVPPCPGHPSSCRYFSAIDLSYNKIKGALPLISGSFLDYSNNEFSKIPSDYASYLETVITLKLSKNRLTGELPSSICETLLVLLDVSNNNLSGHIPSCILGTPNLIFMNLASNKFHGIVPHNISKSCGLMIVDLSNNNLDGNLPRSLARCKDLVLLDIGNNRITDTFPFWLWELSKLQVLILRSNQLYGALELPQRFVSNSSLFQNLRIIDLASNNMNGSLPKSLFRNLISMANLSMTELTTEAFITTFRTVLFNYGIDITIIDKGIQMILEEHIASMMVEIDLSNNKFTSDIPETIGTLSALRALNLSHNMFVGSIPNAFKGLILIESLDLSWNNLSGEIPQELASIDSLTKLNLSFNQLMGRIPQSPHFSTFDNSSFEGNLELCGVPLSEQCNVTSLENNSTSLSTTSVEKMPAVILLCLFIGLGFGIGFGIVIVWPLVQRAIKG